jgi:hypothetical protein
VFLVDYSAFSPTQYSDLLQELSNSSVSVTEMHNEMITGAEAKQKYFPYKTDIRSFQIIHTTRVVAVVAASDLNNADYLHIMSSKIAPVVIVSNTVIVQPRQWYDIFPSFMLPISMFGWVVTIIAFSISWIIYCCCYGGQKIPAAVVVKEDNTSKIVWSEGKNSSSSGIKYETSQNHIFNGIRLNNM